jgi:hypothetical protein
MDGRPLQFRINAYRLLEALAILIASVSLGLLFFYVSLGEPWQQLYFRQRR